MYTVRIVRCNGGLGPAHGSLSRQGLYGETGGNSFAASFPGAFPRNELYGASGRGAKSRLSVFGSLSGKGLYGLADWDLLAELVVRVPRTLLFVRSLGFWGARVS